MSEEFLTRRELREREAAANANAAPEPSLSRRELRDRERAIQQRLDEMRNDSPAPAVLIPVQVMPAQTYVSEPEQPAAVTDFLSQSTFTDDANPGTIPTQIIRREVSTETNSIVLPAVPDISKSQFAVPDSNMVVRTGAIDLPAQSKALTGEITILTQPASVIDVSQAEDISESDTSKVGVIGITPVPARSMPKKNREKVFPGRLRKGWGTVYLVLAVATLMASIATLVFFAYAYKLL